MFSLRKAVMLAFVIAASACGAQTISGTNGKAQARLAQKDRIDTSEMQVVYRHTERDTAIHKRKKHYELLHIGTRYNKYGDYGIYRLDSTITARNGIITNDEHSRLYFQYHCHLDYILTDLQQKELSAYGNVFIDHFVYREPIPDFHWQLHPDTAITVCGQICHKATATWRGRQWTAWYSDIPVNAGPWKFSGLPGLILQVSDSAKLHTYTATALRPLREPITREHRDYIPTTREKFNRARLDYHNQAWRAIAASMAAPVNADGTKATLPKKKLFYVPIELE